MPLNSCIASSNLATWKNLHNIGDNLLALAQKSSNSATRGHVHSVAHLSHLSYQLTWNFFLLSSFYFSFSTVRWKLEIWWSKSSNNLHPGSGRRIECTMSCNRVIFSRLIASCAMELREKDNSFYFSITRNTTENEGGTWAGIWKISWVRKIKRIKPRTWTKPVDLVWFKQSFFLWLVCMPGLVLYMLGWFCTLITLSSGIILLLSLFRSKRREDQAHAPSPSWYCASPSRVLFLSY